EEFQGAYGESWHAITQMPAFRAGLQLLNVRTLDQITSLSNEDIEKHGLLILSNLIGLLKHENDMFNLHAEKTFKFPSDDEIRYMSPEEQAEHEMIAEKFREEGKRKRYAT